MWKAEDSLNSEQILQDYKSGRYDLIKEDEHINKLCLMLAMGDINIVNKMVK